jgi:D-alanyl-D-alanine carboxypeptidase (penicillin-binding protein 5/6)
MAKCGLFLFSFILSFFAGCAHQETAPTRKASAFRIAAPPPGTSNLWPDSAPSIHARYAILIDARSGRTLFQKNADTHTPVASTQKLVTALLVIQKGNLDELISIQREDTSRFDSTKLNLRVGDRYTRRTLLEAMLIASMNDAAEILGRDFSGNSAAIGPLMTQFARSLGANDSIFVNASGLPAPQYSTARDMARIARQAYYDRTLRQIVCKPSYLFRYANGQMRLLKATNLLIGRSLLYNGLKTGYTEASGRCLITSAARNNQAFILVQLGSETRYIFRDAERMIAWAFGE